MRSDELFVPTRLLLPRAELFVVITPPAVRNDVLPHRRQPRIRYTSMSRILHSPPPSTCLLGGSGSGPSMCSR